MTPDVFVVCDVDIGAVKECITPNADGSFTVFLAPWLDTFERERAYLHALRHIHDWDGDSAERSVQRLEAVAHV